MKMIGMRRGTGVLVASLALTLATGAGVASADTGLGHRGLYGRHFLADSGEFPAVHCLYDGRNVLEAVTVQPPLVYARDRTADLDRQRVGWRFRVERDDGTLSNWRTVLTSFVTRATGRDDRPAPLAGLDAGVYGRADRN
nr:hypothetical protein [Chloroflexota bacterium]